MDVEISIAFEADSKIVAFIFMPLIRAQKCNETYKDFIKVILESIKII
jgi:hypothetical protein